MTVPSRVRVGCCGFPVRLSEYARIFRVVEVQQTFYQPPKPQTLERWRNRVPDKFEFTLKAWQLITHTASSPTYRRLREKLSRDARREAGAFCLNSTVLNAWRRTLDCARILRSPIVLFQCPASFEPSTENKTRLRAFFREIRRGLDSPETGKPLLFAWEPRGRWQAEEVRELCEELDLIHAADPFQQNPVSRTGGYFRLHGRTGYRYRYSDEDLKELLQRPAPEGWRYVFFNNLAMFSDAQRFQALLPSEL